MKNKIQQVIYEMKRVTTSSGNIFIAFGHFSPGLEKVCREMEVLKGNYYQLRKGLRFVASLATKDLPEIENQPSLGTQKEQRLGMGYYKIY